MRRAVRRVGYIAAHALFAAVLMILAAVIGFALLGALEKGASPGFHL